MDFNYGSDCKPVSFSGRCSKISAFNGYIVNIPFCEACFSVFPSYSKPTADCCKKRPVQYISLCIIYRDKCKSCYRSTRQSVKLHIAIQNKMVSYQGGRCFPSQEWKPFSCKHDWKQQKFEVDNTYLIYSIFLHSKLATKSLGSIHLGAMFGQIFNMVMTYCRLQPTCEMFKN